jgi:hypothetical protein
MSWQARVDAPFAPSRLVATVFGGRFGSRDKTIQRWPGQVDATDLANAGLVMALAQRRACGFERLGFDCYNRNRSSRFRVAGVVGASRHLRIDPA